MLLAITQGQQFGLCAGFARQPWSRMGDSKALVDDRSDSFRGILKLCHLCHPKFAVLENVLQCWQDEDVMSHIAHLCTTKD